MRAENSNQPLVVSVAEAALMLNLSKGMLCKLIESGALPP
jgi:hypothetical protein